MYRENVAFIVVKLSENNLAAVHLKLSRLYNLIALVYYGSIASNQVLQPPAPLSNQTKQQEMLHQL